MAVIVEGVIDFSDREQKREFLSSAAVWNGFLKVVVKHAKPLRSIQANRRYFGAVIPTFIKFMETQGTYTNKDEAHEFLLQKFVGKEMIDPDTGEVRVVVHKKWRSSRMQVDEFSDYTRRIEEWMLDRFGVVVKELEETEVE